MLLMLATQTSCCQRRQQHLCAEMATELEPARALLWYAGYALDQNLPDA